MEYKRLGKTDLKVSIIGLGCEGFMNKSDDEVKVLVDKAHQEGINFIDFFSSNPQGRSAFGNAIINHRQDWINNSISKCTSSLWRSEEHKSEIQ